MAQSALVIADAPATVRALAWLLRREGYMVATADPGPRVLAQPLRWLTRVVRSACRGRTDAMQDIPGADGFHLSHQSNARLLRIGLSLILFLVGSAPLVMAQHLPLGTTQNAVGTLVVVRPDNIEDRLQGQGTLQLFAGDVLQTGDTQQALIEINDGIQVALNENTILKLLSRWEKAKGITRILRLQQGEIWVKIVTGPQPLEVETPVASAAVRATEFNIKVQDDGQTILTVIEGNVDFGTAFNTWAVSSATVSYAVRGKRCTKPEPTDVQPVIAWRRALTQ